MINKNLIEWPKIDFDEVKKCDVENPTARLLYKGLIAFLFMPEILIGAFSTVLRLKV